MSAYRPIDPNHEAPRTFLRLAGPLLLATGGLFMLVGGIDFFSAFGSFGSPPKLFWCFFVGMPLLAIGGAMTKMGYLGRVARYMSEEITPVATDTFNYAAQETKDGIREVARAIGAGLHDGAPATETRCPVCGAGNDADARFCSQCGRALAAARSCPACRHENDADARFCDHCGRALSA